MDGITMGRRKKLSATEHQMINVTASIKEYCGAHPEFNLSAWVRETFDREIIQIHPMHAKALSWKARRSEARAALEGIEAEAHKDLGGNLDDILLVVETEQATSARIREEERYESEARELRSLWARVRGLYDRNLLRRRFDLLGWLTRDAAALRLPRLAVSPAEALKLLDSGKEPASLSGIQRGTVEAYQVAKIER